MTDFWIVNISNRLISLGDLGILLQPYQSINLGNKKNYPFTDAQIQTSLTTGSLYKRSDKIKIRKIPPALPLKGQSTIGLDEKNEFPSKIRSILKHTEYDYDAEILQISDEEYAKENADMADEDDLGRFKK